MGAKPSTILNRIYNHNSGYTSSKFPSAQSIKIKSLRANLHTTNNSTSAYMKTGYWISTSFTTNRLYFCDVRLQFKQENHYLTSHKDSNQKAIVKTEKAVFFSLNSPLCGTINGQCCETSSITIWAESIFAPKMHRNCSPVCRTSLQNISEMCSIIM